MRRKKKGTTGEDEEVRFNIIRCDGGLFYKEHHQKFIKITKGRSIRAQLWVG
jgi:hypothetical protein